MRHQLMLRPVVALLTFSASALLAENASLVSALLAVFARCLLFSVVPFTLSAFCLFITLNSPPGKLDAPDRLTVFMLRGIALLLLLAGLLALFEGLASAL